MAYSKKKKEADNSLDELSQIKIAQEKARLILTENKARTAALEYEIKSGKYRRIIDIEYDAAETASLVISALEQLPARLGAACEGLTAQEISARVAVEVASIVTELRNGARKAGVLDVDIDCVESVDGGDDGDV